MENACLSYCLYCLCTLSDEQQCLSHVFTQFLKVWGAAEATCLRWYAAGCRTLDDVRARSDLTEQQVVFLCCTKHSA